MEITIKKTLNPADFGLKNTVNIVRESAHEISIIIDRKSRLVMKDGRRLLEQAEKIGQMEKGTRITIKTSAPVCSKTRAFLKQRDITVEPLG